MLISNRSAPLHSCFGVICSRVILKEGSKVRLALFKEVIFF